MVYEVVWPLLYSMAGEAHNNDAGLSSLPRYLGSLSAVLLQPVLTLWACVH